MIAFVLGLLLMTPAQAAGWVPAVSGRRADAGVLRRIARRESRLQRIGVHEIDVRSTRFAWANAVDAGHLRPTTCPFHRRGPSARPWGTRGSWGHVAAFAMQYLPCSPPWVLDIPVISAWVALKRLEVARGRDSTRALRAWAAVTGSNPRRNNFRRTSAEHADSGSSADSSRVEEVERDEALARAGVG